MAENTKYIARVPIVPDDLSNKDSHKNHELVMDFASSDLYVKSGDGYINITGKIKEDVKQIKDGSTVFHIVTGETLPPIKEREENHWYYVITRSEDAGSGGAIANVSYIYYGLIKSYYTTKNYMLIAQNMTTGNDTIQFIVEEGYVPCLYIPISYSAIFKNHDTGDNIEFTIEDRIYAMNTNNGSFIAYDVYILDLYEAGTYKVDIDLEGSDNFTVSFDSNETGIAGLVLPSEMKIPDGNCIGIIRDPAWEDPRFIFKGWSTNKIAEIIINPASYKPESNMTLFAWFEYNNDQTLLTYYSTYESKGTEES